MQNIGLLELANHNEVLRSYVIALLSRPKTELTILTSSWIKNQCYDLHENPLITWIVCKKEESSEKFLKRNQKLIDHLDLIIQTTNEDSHSNIIKVKTSTPLALVVHDLHTNFDPFEHIIVDKKFPQIIIDYLRVIRFQFFKRNRLEQIVNNATYLFLPSINVLKYAETNYRNITKFRYFPFTVNDEISKKRSQNKSVVITIPGNISDKSRNYQIVVEAIKLIPKKIKFHLCLLGKPSGHYGEDIQTRLKEINNITLNCYQSFVSQQEFDEVMRNSDFLILPMNRVMKFDIIGELNGYSCVSGNINDMVRFGIPSIIPSYYPIPNELKEIVLTYDTANSLAKAIIEWLDKSKLNLIKNTKVPSAMSHYSKSEIGNLLPVS